MGRLEYERVAILKFPTEYIMGIAAGGGFMLLVILLILIICRRQSHKAERNYRKMQLLLDNLESNVRNECKQGEYGRLQNFFQRQIFLYVRCHNPFMLQSSDTVNQSPR